MPQAAIVPQSSLTTQDQRQQERVREKDSSTAPLGAHKRLSPPGGLKGGGYEVAGVPVLCLGS